MPSTINSDNGVVSGTSGLKSTADTSGVLALQSNGTTALSVGTDLNVTLTNPLPVASGGTNSTATPTAGGVGYGTGTAHAYTSAGTSGQVLTSAGSGAPTWTTPSSGAFGADLSYVDYLLTLSSAISASSVKLQAISLDGTSELIMLYGSTSAHAVVYNTSTNTFGTPVLVRTLDLSDLYDVGIVKISATSVLICSLTYATTALETVVLTVSGSAITVGTPLATTLAAASTLISTNTRLVAVGSSYVLNYQTTADSLPKFRAITVSGTTPSIGAEFAYAGGTDSLHSYAHSSSVLLHFSASATIGYVYPITVSGTTLTGGTQATVSVTASQITTGALSNSRYALLYVNTTGRGAVVSVSGTTASVSTSATTIAVSNWYPQMQVFSNQALVLTGQAIGDRINVITDTAGTASVGTALAPPGAGLFTGYLSTGKVLFSYSAAGTSTYVQYGISGNDPVREKTFQNVTSTAVITTTVFNSSSYTYPLSGPPNSATVNGTYPILRTSAGKIAPAYTAQLPFTISLDGTYPAKLQQAANPFSSTSNDGISSAVVWGIPTVTSSTATTIQLRKVTLV